MLLLVSYLWIHVERRKGLFDHPHRELTSKENIPMKFWHVYCFKGGREGMGSTFWKTIGITNAGMQIF